MNPLKDHFFEHALKEPIVSDEQTSTLNRYLDIFSHIAIESFYVLDIQQKQFCHIKPDDLFLCGFSIDDALKEGYGFYSKIVYPEDLSLWTDIQNAILRYLKDFNEKQSDIDYFSCTFRLQRVYSFLPQRPLSQMVYHRIKHILEDGELRYLICSVRGSTSKKTGNLCMYNKDHLTYREYNFITKRWKQKTIGLLTEREKAILILAGQGKNSGEISSDLCKGHNTIRNQIKSLFSKLDVHSMQEAIEFARYHRLIYPKQNKK
ncbi:MAG: LuxR C-terminal-related transcriptional regulator [Tannerella sp.]|jgi:DNA-binding CsgD family transcriptional regulator|nr:LuxR C-terminal-related transcriptional regulator [Tannerella sp.]